ncbi:hypothetical protein QYM23_24615 [Bacillus cereus]|uniref:Uncharacterized protein n=1 Tax=Bacillus cereus TaxID=1396 RepID=A0AAW7NM32_BACCE|nr:hypothetical protein [Bacillus cereus]MDN4876005.1 hypothetical protein [Bacillus cereus]
MGNEEILKSFIKCIAAVSKDEDELNQFIEDVFNIDEHQIKNSDDKYFITIF